MLTPEKHLVENTKDLSVELVFLERISPVLCTETECRFQVTLYFLIKAGEVGKTSERISLMRKDHKNKCAGSDSRGNAAPKGVYLSQGNIRSAEREREKNSRISACYSKSLKTKCSI